MTNYLKKDSISYLGSSAMDATNLAVHAFLCRTGGVSPAPCASLNFDARELDDQKNVDENTRIAGKAFGVALDKTYNPIQVHGEKIALIKDKFAPERIEADAVITDITGLPIGIQTADCQPILFLDPIKRAMGAAHAGWKGTVADIAIKTIISMQKAFGSKPEDIIASLGPCIGPCCYEIGGNVAAQFEGAFGANPACIIKKGGQKARLDIPLANRTRLLSAGVKAANIDMNCPCTSCNADKFFSYRKERGRTGRQLNFIMLK